MTGPGHAEKEALQREAKEEAVAGQAGAEARSVRELGEGAGLGLPHLWKEGCARRTPAGRGSGWWPRADDRDSLTPVSLEGVGKDGELGEGNPPQLERGAIPAGPWRRNDSPHTHPVGSWSGWWEDQASEEVGLCEGKPHGRERGSCGPLEPSSIGVTASSLQGSKMGCDPVPTAAAGAGSGGRSRPTPRTGNL